VFGMFGTRVDLSSMWTLTTFSPSTYLLLYSSLVKFCPVCMQFSVVKQTQGCPNVVKSVKTAVLYVPYNFLVHDGKASLYQFFIILEVEVHTHCP
jgi:hypothetical protein